jgi:SAM-dependent methyltransferase
MTHGSRAGTRAQGPTAATGLLGDTKARDYARKLQLFNAFAEPEIRRAIASLGLQPGERVLDAGCGTGEALSWLSAAVQPEGLVAGLDLAAAHTAAARLGASSDVHVLQGDLLRAPFANASFDLVWSVNTINHLRDPLPAMQALSGLLCGGGRIALGQSSFLPDMYFAWDARLERLTNEAVRQYYHDRYALSERDLTQIRSVVGLLRRANLQAVTVKTFTIERIRPLSAADEAYLREAIFRDTWGERLRPYLSGEDFADLTQLCDPLHARYALHRPDFHFLQTFTLATGAIGK